MTGARHADLPLRDGDLVEFLLARFDEDEEAARFVQLSPAPTNRALVDHVLRDADAKRQLVQYFRELEERGARGATMDHALRLIAQTYADHPHYRDEWRP
ncbi:hypothetical protein GCU56_21170 [Geodermatophilus sabuli]|uniref:Uncharacterized protein n=1 Tax=Geodermatophilus sabuli TaxID=1564158 RepID=A0A7K3W6C4_9ACTN|nr:hypothetical protein [Geodermatophilus sabuli]